MAIIDTHQHYWKLSEVEYPWLIPEYGPIYDTFTPEQLRPQLEEAGVDKTVLVQSANSYEDTASMLVKADYNEWIGAVVGWVTLLDPEEANQRLEMYEQNPKFVAHQKWPRKGNKFLMKLGSMRQDFMQ